MIMWNRIQLTFMNIKTFYIDIKDFMEVIQDSNPNKVYHNQYYKINLTLFSQTQQALLNYSINLDKSTKPGNKI